MDLFVKGKINRCAKMIVKNIDFLDLMDCNISSPLTVVFLASIKLLLL